MLNFVLAVVGTLAFASMLVFVTYASLARAMFARVDATLAPMRAAVLNAVNLSLSRSESLDKGLVLTTQALAAASALVERIEHIESRLDALESRHLRTPNIH